jgi:hypothetical protein
MLTFAPIYCKIGPVVLKLIPNSNFLQEILMATKTIITPTTVIGKAITIKAGTIVARAGQRAKRSADSIVTVRKAEAARNGKTRIFWKSHGIIASALIG